MYHFAIIGAGAVGGWLAGHLAEQHSLCFVDNRIKASSRLSLKVDSLSKGAIRRDLAVRPTIPNCHWLFICVKAHQVSLAIQNLDIPKQCQVVLMVNGLGAQQSLLSRIPAERLNLASNSHGALLLQKTTGQISVKHTGVGKIDMGSVIPHHPAPEQLTLLQQTIPSFAWQDNIYPALWLKLAVNCCINPLTALHNCPNGELLQARYRSEIFALCQELSQVAKVEGIHLSQQALVDGVLMVANKTAHNYSSMQQDIKHHRPSEIDYINGYVVRLAETHQQNCQHHRALLEQIKRLESQYE